MQLCKSVLKLHFHRRDVLGFREMEHDEELPRVQEDTDLFPWNSTKGTAGDEVPNHERQKQELGTPRRGKTLPEHRLGRAECKRLGEKCAPKTTRTQRETISQRSKASKREIVRLCDARFLTRHGCQQHVQVAKRDETEWRGNDDLGGLKQREASDDRPGSPHAFPPWKLAQEHVNGSALAYFPSCCVARCCSGSRYLKSTARRYLWMHETRKQRSNSGGRNCCVRRRILSLVRRGVPI